MLRDFVAEHGAGSGSETVRVSNSSHIKRAVVLFQDTACRNGGRVDRGWAEVSGNNVREPVRGPMAWPAVLTSLHPRKKLNWRSIVTAGLTRRKLRANAFSGKFSEFAWLPMCRIIRM